MRLDDQHELSNATVAAVRVFYSGLESAAVPVGEADLARFVTGLATAAEREETTAALIESRSLRDRLVSMHRELKAAQKHSVAESRIAPALAKCLAEGLNGSLSFYSRMREWCLTNDWTAISGGSSSEGISARSALAAAGRTLQGILSSPRFAVVRGSDDAPSIEGYLPPGLAIEFEANLDSDGMLKAKVLFREQVSGALQAIVDKPVALELLDPSGGSIPIATGRVCLQAWSVDAPDFGSVCGLSPGLLPSSLFRISLGNAQPLPRGRNHLFAEFPSGSGPVAFQILDEPRIQGAELIVTLLAQESVRQMLAGYRIDFLVPVGSILLLLGTWPMDIWNEDAHTFRMPVPGAKDGSFETGSILQVRLLRIKDEPF
ncbi:MAG TPA: hypothetical protein VHE55_13025 [Fimbriimonadaceae bacterium]|nr:hypothetical protein [Fimbriimonadaceae bacterium]